MQDIMNNLTPIESAWFMFGGTTLWWIITAVAQKHVDNFPSRVFFGFNYLLLLLTLCMFISIYPSYLALLVPLLIIIFSSDENINLFLKLFSKDIDIQIILSKRLADWCEKMSAAAFIGCFIGVITSGNIPVVSSHDKGIVLNDKQFIFILFGVLTVFTTLFISLRLTIYNSKVQNKIIK